MMTRIWNEDGFLDDDPWVIETEEMKAVEGQRAILSLKEFHQRIDNVSDNGVGFGVSIRPDEATSELAPHLHRIALVAVAFPAFNDGRAFSHASLLRTRYGYGGEIRAIGDVLIDQIPLMLRCGINSFAVSNRTALNRLAEGRLPGIRKHYQPAARDASRAGGYSWRRVPRDAA